MMWYGRKIVQLLKEPRGTTLVLVAAALFMLLGISALALDAGFLYWNKAQVQTAADAAALAGAQELRHSPEAAESEARAYAALNGRATDNVTVDLTVANQITVTVQRMVDLYFAHIFGVPQWPVQATATAGLQPATGVAGVVPFGVAVNTGDLAFGTQVTLKYGSGGSYYGNFQALALGGTGASKYLDNIKQGYDGVIHIGDWVQTETGNMAGPTVSGVSYRVNADSGVSYTTVQEGSPRIIIVPILESFEVVGRTDVRVSGFAAFFLEATGKQGNENYVIGRFLKIVTPGEGGTNPDWGVYTTKLIR
ncbi:pilus assembly protein TadG-related protein [Anaeromusa acidaminophila]|uniref:pilus assembly protein TadG-related protein n=1 Tax=Anaeromusa acidaminophila TaxID=81464 RepID=UPI00039E777E|nr:pilus assembly protein TadG-related protein [Anaeromusa acidaminophila]